MREKLRLLDGLQKIDTKLDEVHSLRGDLPKEVDELKIKVAEIQSQITVIDDFLKHGTIDRQLKESESLELIDKIEKYKTQQLKVRTNKEYDSLTKEIDGANELILKYENEIEAYAGLAQEKKNQKEELVAQITILQEDLTTKSDELDEITSSTEKEEKLLLSQREKLIASIDEDDLTSYTRIREAKKKAVVAVKRGSCSGCYNRVPPQFVLEIKRNDKLYLCEHCGRILVSEELSMDDSPIF